jgi:ATP-dependent DNA helicase RecG
LTVYGDLDVSVIDELPPGRGSITTVKRYEKDRPAIYKFIDQEVQKGRQAYIVYPLIEESEKVDLESAIKNYTLLKKKIFPQHACGLLHGRMKSEEKEKAILDFKNNITKILVSTTVVEVGVDVANATIMLVEHAERFGLAQLHQLRGRIGRGIENSYCILCVKPPLSAEGQARLKAITATLDGFKIAEMDLEIRGPGEFLGTRQSGLPDLKMANILTDTKLLVMAREEAFRVIEKDPAVQLPEHRLIREHLRNKYKDKMDLLQIG